jgi:tetratricopeptide (TPR) repeat protein
MTKKKDIEKELAELNEKIKNNPGDIELYKTRAAIFYKLNEYGKALNDYYHILEKEPENKEVKTEIDMINTILRYTNTDIYASTNTNMDPWLE